MAQNLGTTFTDLWYTPGEDGWGVTIDHQQNVMFLTFFIYRDGQVPLLGNRRLDQSRNRRTCKPTSSVHR